MTSISLCSKAACYQTLQCLWIFYCSDLPLCCCYSPVGHLLLIKSRFAGVDQDHNAFAQTRDRPINPAAPDINNAPSLGQLYEQPIGLAYITSAPCFEINGPIRFKRSVSGNRYKPPASDLGSGWMSSPQGLVNGLDAPRAPNASPSPSKQASIDRSYFTDCLAYV